MASDALKSRTDAKLRYAAIHLNELKYQPAGRGHDFERSHQEAFLAQLFGAYASLLQELNVDLGCDLLPKDVTQGNMYRRLKSEGRSNPALKELYELNKNDTRWFWHAKVARDHTTHISGIPLSHYPQDGITSLKNPKTNIDFSGDATNTLASWLTEMMNLVARIRSTAQQD